MSSAIYTVKLSPIQVSEKARLSHVQQSLQVPVSSSNPCTQLFNVPAYSESRDFNEQISHNYNKDTRSGAGIRTDASSTTRLPIYLLQKAHVTQGEQTARGRQGLCIWYQRLSELAAYKRQHGDCNVPQLYEPNRALGHWVNRTRENKKKFDAGHKSSLTTRQVQMIDELGFEWAKPRGETLWNIHFSELVAYKSSFGDTLVPTKSPLGRWVSLQRTYYKLFMEGKASRITSSRIAKLNEIDFVWFPQIARNKQREYSR
jgi:hypothetical protein